MVTPTGIDSAHDSLGGRFELPCGLVLRNRLVKSAMSDSLGNGVGDPSAEQLRLYERWSRGGAALSIIGEVQVDPNFPEKPGNLVLRADSDDDMLRRLVAAGSHDGSHIWPQLGHGGALAHSPISVPAGPSALQVGEWSCAELSQAAIEALPTTYAKAARRAKAIGFTGVQLHAGHGFLLSQFLSPLFNRRTDRYGGTIEARSQILIEIVEQVRAETGSDFAVAVRINSTDQLEGGLSGDDALVVVERLGQANVDLIDISGGTYFPGAAASSDRRSTGPYFVEFATRARSVTDVPLMVTGGFKTLVDAANAVSGGSADLVGLGRPLVLDPDLPSKWLGRDSADPQFPRFDSPPPGGVTAWYTMRLTALANNTEDSFNPTLEDAVDDYETRDAARTVRWTHQFGNPTQSTQNNPPG
jgi:2,4-dienoyl-CoA reductase-like NADH-dependent reductase (Old Yellow Enzyme family)